MDELDHPQATPKRKRPRKLIVSLTLAPIVLMTVAANIANAFFAPLFDNHPLVLIAFDARARNLILVTAKIGFLAWFVVAMIRRTIFHPLYFLLGRWYGEAAVRWIAKRSPDLASLVTTIEGWFPRYGWLIVTINSHPLICVLAGASAMRMAAFVAYNIVGNAISLLIIWRLGEAAREPIDDVGGFIGQYSLPLTIVTFTLVAFYVIRGRSRGESNLESVDEIEAELEAELENEEETNERPDRRGQHG